MAKRRRRWARGGIHLAAREAGEAVREFKELHPFATALAVAGAAIVAGVVFLAPFINALYNALDFRPPMITFFGLGFPWAWIAWYVIVSGFIGAMMAWIYNAVVRSAGK